MSPPSYSPPIPQVLNAGLLTESNVVFRGIACTGQMLTDRWTCRHSLVYVHIHTGVTDLLRSHKFEKKLLFELKLTEQLFFLLLHVYLQPVSSEQMVREQINWLYA